MTEVSDVKVFVPAKDFSISLEFYQALGWKQNWIHNGGLAELELAGHRFLLQNFYVRQWAENFMIYLEVASAQEWYEHISKILMENQKFGNARVAPPKEEAHATVTYAWDPSGVLLHFAEE